MNLEFNQSRQVVYLSDEIAEWTTMFGSNMMDSGELAYLAATLAAYPWDGKGIVVEIGAYRGSTSVFMAKVLQHFGHRVPILSIDPFERVARSPTNPQGKYAAYLKTVRKHKMEDVCLPLVALSKDAALVVPATVGVLVVDGGHEHAVVSQDLRDYVPKILPGGFILIDDYETYAEVTRAVDEYFMNAPEFTIVHRSYFVVGQRR